MSFQSPFSYMMEYEASDGLVLRGIHIPGNETCIIHLHGLASRWYSQAYHEHLSSMYSKRGWGYLSCNNRGAEQVMGRKNKQTGKEEHVGYTFERFEDAPKDTEGMVSFALKQGYKNIILQGHSSGCQKAIFSYTSSALVRNNTQRIVLLSPCDDIGLAHHWYGKEAFEAKIREAKEAPMSYLFSPDFSFGVYVSKETFLSHFDDQNNFDIFHYYDKSTPFTSLSAVNCPTLAIFGTEDFIVNKDDISSTYEQFSQIDLQFIENANHKYEGCEANLATCIAMWLDKTAS